MSLKVVLEMFTIIYQIVYILYIFYMVGIYISQ